MLKRITAVLVALCVLLTLTGALSPVGVFLRTWPVLLFLLLMTAVSAVLDQHGVFDGVAAWLVRHTGGRPWPTAAVFGVLCFVVTTVLSLDTTIVLLTPVALTLAKRGRVSALPYLFLTVWVANTGSLLLPVSNLTNLLAQQTAGLTTLEFARLMALPQLFVLIVVALVFVLFFRKQVVPVSAFTASPVRFTPHALAIGAFTVTILLGIAPWIAAAGLLVILLAIRPVPFVKALPWTMALFALALFILMDGMPTPQAMLSPVAAAGAGAAVANLTNNLPAYLTLEPFAPMGPLLIGVNAGPLITPWASLANLLWMTLAAAKGVRIPMSLFVVSGLVLVPLVILAGCLGL
ncbi:MAG: ArsB/NhaD family transporter [Corynebacterium glucuronolyticum]|nr:hypothetical protein [Corynebacterium glucuronolyticum]MDD7586328.1 ArsB/NhaD family transporter [Mycobacteriaceae bacterium]MDY5834551.1 ArsB/NhaD family transporter [Corynebacterium glucuronolyticum]